MVADLAELAIAVAFPCFAGGACERFPATPRQSVVPAGSSNISKTYITQASMKQFMKQFYEVMCGFGKQLDDMLCSICSGDVSDNPRLAWGGAPASEP